MIKFRDNSTGPGAIPRRCYLATVTSSLGSCPVEVGTGQNSVGQVFQTDQTIQCRIGDIHEERGEDMESQ